MCDLIIDCNEKNAEEFKNKIQLTDPKIKIKIEKCHVGDIHFLLNNKVIAVIERKTICDLSSSIPDGRYNEQKLRLKEYMKKGIQIIYLVEDWKQSYKPIHPRLSNYNTMLSAMIGTMIRDKIYVFFSNDNNETVNIVAKMVQKIKKHKKLLMGDVVVDELEYSSHVKIEKKKNMTPEICFIAQLSQIPGVSNTIARVIYDKYGNMIKLLDEYREKGDMTICDIKYDISNGKQRKIGKVISKRIHEFMIV